MSGCQECGRRRLAVVHAEADVRERTRLYVRHVESGRMTAAVLGERVAGWKAEAARCRALLAEHEAACGSAVAS